jgi:hypothetical protein
VAGLLSLLSDELAKGFGKPRSYRGYYEQIAFEPKKDVDVHYMLLQAKSANGATFTGYKGGNYKMGLDTTVNIACYGVCGDDDEITEDVLEEMLNA